MSIICGVSIGVCSMSTTRKSKPTQPSASAVDGAALISHAPICGVPAAIGVLEGVSGQVHEVALQLGLADVHSVDERRQVRAEALRSTTGRGAGAIQPNAGVQHAGRGARAVRRASGTASRGMSIVGARACGHVGRDLGSHRRAQVTQVLGERLELVRGRAARARHRSSATTCCAIGVELVRDAGGKGLGHGFRGSC